MSDGRAAGIIQAGIIRRDLEAILLVMERVLADLDKIPEPWARKAQRGIIHRMDQLQPRIEQAWRIETAREG